MSHLKIDNVSKYFRRVEALRDLNLEVHDQEFMVLLGPTGAGKTTSLRCVAGLEKYKVGNIYMDGRLIDDVSPAKRNVSFVFQNYALYPRKTVFENIAFPLLARRYDAAAIKKRIDEVTTMLRINHLQERMPGQLSGGEMQRVALSRALVRNPSIFLMDEPLTNLDFKLRAQMRGELKRIQQDLNATFFYVTNDQVEALSMGDRVAVLNHGVLQQVGPPQEVYEKPDNLFVAGFIGSVRMNFFHCAYDSNGRSLVSEDNSWRLALQNGRNEALIENGNLDRLTFGIRPEDMHVAQTEADEDEAIIAGDVYIAEPLGDRIIYDVQVGNSLLKVKTPPSLQLQPGEQIKLKVNMARAHIFDRDKEHAIRATTEHK